jgi:5-methyltetrahydropteroyltriglutamate--homocysteine methyltransferase
VKAPSPDAPAGAAARRSVPRLLPTSVVGSHALPGWFWTSLEAIKEGKYGQTDVREVMDDAVNAAVRDQERAGIDLITDGEMRRWYFVQGFYSRSTVL